MDYEVMMNSNVRIGQVAPEFEAETTMGHIKMSDYKGKWLVLFSHPRRFYSRMYNWVYCFFKNVYIFRRKKYLFIRTKHR